MPSSGIRRKVDDLGRIVIPAPLRRALGITEGDVVEVALDGDRLMLTPLADRCAFCAGTDDLETFSGKAICWSCMAAVRALDRERESSRPPFG